MQDDELINLNELFNQARAGYKKDSPIQSLNFTSYNVPTFKEKINKKWVNCGQDNLFPNYLVDKMNKCAIHAAIIESKTKQITGEGFQVEDSSDKDQLAALTEFLKKIEANKILQRIAFDYTLFGYFFLGITWSNDRTKIANIFHVDASSIRVGVPELQEDGFRKEVEVYYYSEDWTQYKKKDFTPDEIPVFNPNNRIEPTSLLMVRGYRPSTRFYNLPDYIGAMNSIELNYEISNYMLNSIKNGLSPSLLINFNEGNPSDEEKSVVYNSVKQLYAGSSNAGKFILSFNNGKDNATEVTPIEVSNQSEVLANLSEFCTNDIVRGHRVPNPVLVGIAIAGQLGLTNEVEQSSELFVNEVIYPIQLLLEETLQELLEINGFTLKVHIKDSRPISFTYEDSTLLNILTVDELRSRIGMAPLSKADIPNLGVNIKSDAKGESGAKPAAKPKPITKEEKDEQGMSADEPKTNAVLRSLSGREYQAMMRIIRQYSQKKITRQQASIMLSQAYGLSNEDVDTFLGQEDEEVIDTVDKLNSYVTGHKVENNIQPRVKPFVDEVKKDK